MKFDVIVGNPPYGMRTSNTHLKIFNTVLEFCNDKLCFIMPSKPITQQLDTYWYDVFKGAVCTDIEVIDKSAFPNTTMDDVAIYYCDRTIPEEEIDDKYCKKLDVDNNLFDAVGDVGQLFIDKMSEQKSLELYSHIHDGTDKSIERAKKSIKDDIWYLNVNRANGSFGAKWLSGELQKIGILSQNDEIDYIDNNRERKNIIGCPSIDYGENIKSLMIDCKVLRYSLWLLQKSQDMLQDCFKYVPDIAYDELTGDTPRELDKSLLLACDFSDEDAEKILAYLYDSNDGNGFDFKQSRNDVVRGSLR